MKIIFLFLSLIGGWQINPELQANAVIKGQVTDSLSMEPIPMAHVSIFDAAQSVMLGGTTTDWDGYFSLYKPNAADQFSVRISALGYTTQWHHWQNRHSDSLILFSLIPSPLQLNEVLVQGTRIRGKAAEGITQYFVNSAMLETSHTGTDLLRLVPGLQVDMQKQIRLHGSTEVLIMVDGIQRDRQFLSQLPARRIDRIEISQVPGATHDASYSGVINIILIPEREASLSGQIKAELPLSAGETYLFPNMHLHLGLGRITAFAAWNGELSYFRLLETEQRSLDLTGKTMVFSSRSDIDQAYRSHRFHYGVDASAAEHTQINFYGYLNPWSNEHNGHITLNARGLPGANGIEEGLPNLSQWHARRIDHDRNLSMLHSLWVKHKPASFPAHEITAEFTHHSLSAKRHTRFTDEQHYLLLENRMDHQQSRLSMRLDHRFTASPFVSLHSGVFLRHDAMDDAALPATALSFSDKGQAFYSQITARTAKLSLSGGLRLEQQKVSLRGNDAATHIRLLPAAELNYAYASGRQLSLQYREALRRPGYTRLNPGQRYTDHFSYLTGNPGLKQSHEKSLHLAWAATFDKGFLSARLYYRRWNNVIEALARPDASGSIENLYMNVGRLQEPGIQTALSWQLSPGINVSGSLDISWVNAVLSSPYANDFHAGPAKWATGAGGAITAGLTHGFSASLALQHSSPRPGVLHSRWMGTQYFLSLHKELNHGLSASLSSAMPLGRRYTYHASAYAQPELQMQSQGQILMSAVPLWMSISWSFGGETSARSRLRNLPRAEEEPRGIL